MSYDGGVHWRCEPFWTQNTNYLARALVSSKDGSDNARQLWQATNAGISGATPAQPTFPIFEPRTVIEPNSEVGLEKHGQFAWVDSGVIRPVGLPPGDPSWDPNRTYSPGDVVHVPGPGNGRYYTALRNVAEGEDPRDSPLSYQNFPAGYAKLPLTWRDNGTSPPSLVASGQPADQTISLLNAPLPQVHSLSYFNIASGVVVSFTRPPTFGYIPAASVKDLPSNLVPTPGPVATTNLGIDPRTGCSINTTPNKNGTTPVYYCPGKVGRNAYPVDPVLGLTIYYPPVDAETPFHWTRQNLIPGASLAFSLANPTNNFYVGGSNEFLVRNVQIFYGLALLKTPVEVGAPTTQPVWGGAGTAPAVMTKSGFQKGFFLGFTFNLSSFIQSLGFGGSKGSGQ